MRRLAAFLVSIVLLTGCSPGGTTLPKTHVVIDTAKGPAAFTVEVAADEASREKGLMYRTKLAPDAGMLFDFHKPSVQSFWMKNTPISLDMIFIQADGKIANIATNTIPYSEDSIASGVPVRAVLEIKGGRSAELGIEPGQTVHAKIFGNGP